MKKILILLITILTLISITSCGYRDAVIIYSSLEDFRVQTIIDDLNKVYPDIKVKIQYYSTGTNAAKLNFEGKRTDADIFLALEGPYVEKIEKNLYNLENEFSVDNYLKEVLPPTNKYHVFSREAGCIILNTKVLENKKINEPTCYEDLLKPEYKDLIMMPNPKSSGTGFAFYNSIYSTYGKDRAIEYFSKLSTNIKQYTESGSGPVKAIDRGEIAIGLGMVSQAALYASKNKDIKLISFKEGLPYSMFCMGLIDGKQTKKNVMTVYDYLFNVSVLKDKELHVAEHIFKNQKTENIYYPKDYTYSKMDNIYDFEYKEQLLDLWKW